MASPFARGTREAWRFQSANNVGPLTPYAGTGCTVGGSATPSAWMHDAEPAPVGQHAIADLGLATHPRAQDVRPALLLQVRDRLGADHAPVGDDADAADTEPPPQPVHDRQQGGHVGDVARPQFAADRPAVAVQDGAHDHLLEIGPMILAVPVLPERLAAVALEVQAGGVEEDQVQVGEQVAAAFVQGLFHEVLGAARRERRGGALVVEFLAEPGHGAIQVMQVQRLGARDRVVGFPLIGGAVAAAGEQAVQDGEEDRPFDRELEAAIGAELLDHGLATGVAQEPLEGEHRAQAVDADDRALTLAVGGQEQDLLREAGPGGEQGIELARLLEAIQPTQRHEDALPGAAVAPVVFDDLEVGPWAGVFGAKEHGAPREKRDTMIVASLGGYSTTKSE